MGQLIRFVIRPNRAKLGKGESVDTKKPQPVIVERKPFESAISKLLSADPVPLSKIKGKKSKTVSKKARQK